MEEGGALDYMLNSQQLWLFSKLRNVYYEQWSLYVRCHFIQRYTLLVPGWRPFCLQNCLKSL